VSIIKAKNSTNCAIFRQMPCFKDRKLRFLRRIEAFSVLLRRFNNINGGIKMFCYLIRHGKDDDTVRGGWSTSGLTDEGKLQVKDLVEYILKNNDDLKIGKIYSSDLPRAAETALPISSALDLDVNFMPEFRETNNGIFAGMPHDIADKKYPGLFWSTLEWDEPYPQGESPRIFFERIKTAWEKFSAAIIKENKNVILVSHSGVMNVIFSLIESKTFSNKTKFERINHATIMPLKYVNGQWEGGS
jgi:probable phosphoglycerate mutase